MSLRRTDILERKEDILKWIEEHQSKAYICRQLGCKPETLNSYLKQMGINYEGNMGGKGIKHDSRYLSAIEYTKSTCVKSHLLKEKLIRDGLKEYKCELCGLSEWQGQPIPLELHHKDGNHYNNELDNLQILCPNCHALQPNNSGKASNKKVLKEKLDRLSSKEKTAKNKFFCPDCGAIVSAKGLRCKSCASKINNFKMRKVEDRPSREQLKEEIRNNSFLQLGKKYDVSDNAIRKWCKVYKLPYRKKDINQYSDEEWKDI